jgi:hypothetical protein
MVESPVNLMTRNRPVRPGAAPGTDRPFNLQDIPGSELLEHTIARIEREFGGFASLPLASGHSAQPIGPAEPHHPSLPLRRTPRDG